MTSFDSEADATLVVIPFFNRVTLVLEAATKLISSGWPANRILIVNNGSDPIEVEFLRQSSPDLPMVTQSNLGFSGAVNRGLRCAIENHYRFTFLLNSDASVDARGLIKLQDFLNQRENGRVGACSPLIFSGGKLDFAGGRIERCGWRARHLHTLREAELIGPGQALFLTGSALLCRNAALQEVGFFDERFFMYWEDCDVSLRLKDAGWDLRIVPTVQVEHAVGASSPPGSGLLMNYYVDRNRFLMWRKHGRGIKSCFLLCKASVAQVMRLPSSDRIGKLNAARALTDGLAGRFGKRDLVTTQATHGWAYILLWFVTLPLRPFRKLIVRISSKAASSS